MPGPGTGIGQGQTVALLIVAAGLTLLLLALARETQSLRRVRTRLRSALVGALLVTAALALLLVRRLDPPALSRVLAATATAFAMVGAEQVAQRPTRFGRLDCPHGRHLIVRCPHCSPPVLPKEL
jgi:uncharacterized membrane protein